MPADYIELDARIVAAIGDGAETFSQIFQRTKVLALPLTKADRWGKRNSDRLVDRRLQVLRKAGLIAYMQGKWTTT